MAEQVIISNGIVEATVSTQAAEVIEFKKISDGINVVWCRDEKYWFNCNPVLFPYYSMLEDGKYELDGKEYFLGQHGFARRALFEIEEKGTDYVVLTLEENDYTLSVYPFRFKLTVKYELAGSKIILSYKVENRDNRPLPFNIGFHPAFNCPMTEDEKYEDYRIEFEQTENLTNDLMDLGYGDSFELKDVLIEGSHFYYDHQIKSSWAQLTNGKHTVRVGCAGYSILGFWRKNPGTPFMCIEPWDPDTSLDKDYTFRKDTLNNLLPVNEEFECSYYWELL